MNLIKRYNAILLIRLRHNGFRLDLNVRVQKRYKAFLVNKNSVP